MASISTIEEIVDWIIGTSEHTAEQGDRFERLMLQFFRHAPAWAEQFDEVWLWSEWPGNGGETDHGIDLVAKNRGEDSYTAIQAKCYRRTTTLNKPDVDSFISASGRDHFTRRILVATTYNIGTKAQKEMDGQTVPVQLLTLDGLRDSGINWADWSPDNFTIERSDPKTPKPYQREAIDSVIEGFQNADRGKAIMACGTGKTYTAQVIAEEAVGPGGLVLVLAPSISLVSQTITSWYGDATVPMSVFGVCSDTTAGKRGDNADISPYDLVIPPTTDPAVLAANVAKAPAGHMKVIFSTYQSSERIGQAQQLGLGQFDLIICDEAHRTTGVQLESEDTKPFQYVHDNENIDATKRLYMTATPRVYKPSQKQKASEKDALVASMDDIGTYGETFHTLTFRDAVNLGELTDYKVLILTVEESAVNEAFQRHTAELGEVNLPEAAQMVGCLNALAKKERVRNEGDIRAFDEGDIVPLQRAVAFSNTIKASTRFADEFARIAYDYQHVTGVGEGERLKIETDHVDGKQNTVQRNKKLDWLTEQPGEHICRVLSNAKCLTEGIDVPTLDAVLFLEPRKSHVDIIQAVGRVMRTAPGKDFGYIVIPIAVPPGTRPEAVLKDGRFKTVWQVLSALRSHDPDMNRDVSQIRFGKKPRNIDFGHIGNDQDLDDNSDPEEDDADDPVTEAIQGQLEFDIEQFQELCWASMVQKVGDTAYLKKWAKNVADIAAALEERIESLISTRDVKAPFDRFVLGLKESLNESISIDDAVGMLAQHLITRPVFESIFPGYSLLASNPIAQAMQEMIDVLETQNVAEETRELEAFYRSVSYHVDGLEDPQARQEVLIELYEEFFKTAFPKRSASLGIVYTPIQVTNFIIRAADEVLQRHFNGASLSDEGVHILDPFTGTGTFIVQMLRSGLIKPHDLARKFVSELHANEIQLLAYYIATVNIETAYRTLTESNGPVQAFPGIVYTDTFQLDEGESRLGLGIFPSNSRRAEAQRALDIRVILGNPPYSAGQDNENDDNQNASYPALDAQIEGKYAARSEATNKRQLYDSYVRALRWATNQLEKNEDGGIIAFVTNGGFIANQQFDGFRKAVAEEFDYIYCFDCRGNQYTRGELSDREGGKIFDSGSRAPVAITLMVKTSNEGSPAPASIRYYDIGDYLTREQKLETIAALAVTDEGLLDSISWQDVVPNSHGDWINPRSADFAQLDPLSPEDGDEPIFTLRSLGLATGRDQWNFNSDKDLLAASGTAYVQAYNDELDAFHTKHPNLTGNVKDRAKVVKDEVPKDQTRFSWTRADYGRLAQRERYEFDPERIYTSQYRPFFKQHLNFNLRLNAMTYQLPKMFPSNTSANRAICMPTAVSKSEFGVLMVQNIPSLHLWPEGTAVFPEKVQQPPADEATMFDEEPDFDGWTSNITKITVSRFSEIVGRAVTTEEIFHYVYGALHRPEYATAYHDDLSKQTARLPPPQDAQNFTLTSTIGAQLAELHLSYDTVDPWPGLVHTGDRNKLDIEKPTYGPSKDRSRVVLSDSYVISEIPAEAHQYKVGGRSPLDWFIDRYRIRTGDAAIVNDPTTWAGQDYVVDLVGRLVTVGMRSHELIDELKG